MAGKTFPAFPAHAQSAILRIWQEAHGRHRWDWIAPGYGDISFVAQVRKMIMHGYREVADILWVDDWMKGSIQIPNNRNDYKAWGNNYTIYKNVNKSLWRALIDKIYTVINFTKCR